MPLFDLSLNYIQRDRVESFDPLLYLMVCFVFFYSPVLTLGIKSTRKDLVCSFAILPLSGWVFFSERMQLGAKTKLWHKGQNVKTQNVYLVVLNLHLPVQYSFTFV